MRVELAKINQVRTRFRAKVERFGCRENHFTNRLEDTILLKDVTKADDTQILTDHVWFSVGKQIQSLNLKPGDIIEFDARVDEYVKGYFNYNKCIDNRELDYNLSYPTKFLKIT
ncbi:hypothetical protein A4S05_23525 [Nostoc sp. KVJ20]|uniref:FliM/FliN family flagellar motor switch protein n=1 Tax=Nostoc sp. KVJ20 TaxID=457944 RepID=UPI00083DEDFA|nr:FliM/FliN family flagellar motor switch protein [Nostoc sp. KVJ20]ODH02584.1 hypothetical protein A4S05_23525 [Nostoc sp. KVJ20]